ncbi:MAG: hypothetical protein Q6370_012760, partial [Candidatus Sigynarchaeota archaeon]
MVSGGGAMAFINIDPATGLVALTSYQHGTGNVIATTVSFNPSPFDVSRDINVPHLLVQQVMATVPVGAGHEWHALGPQYVPKGAAMPDGSTAAEGMVYETIELRDKTTHDVLAAFRVQGPTHFTKDYDFYDVVVLKFGDKNFAGEVVTQRDNVNIDFFARVASLFDEATRNGHDIRDAKITPLQLDPQGKVAKYGRIDFAIGDAGRAYMTCNPVHKFAFHATAAMNPAGTLHELSHARGMKSARVLLALLGGIDTFLDEASGSGVTGTLGKDITGDFHLSIAVPTLAVTAAYTDTAGTTRQWTMDVAAFVSSMGHGLLWFPVEGTIGVSGKSGFTRLPRVGELAARARAFLASMQHVPGFADGLAVQPGTASADPELVKQGSEGGGGRTMYVRVFKRFEGATGTTDGAYVLFDLSSGRAYMQHVVVDMPGGGYCTIETGMLPATQLGMLEAMADIARAAWAARTADGSVITMSVRAIKSTEDLLHAKSKTAILVVTVARPGYADGFSCNVRIERDDAGPPAP